MPVDLSRLYDEADPTYALFIGAVLHQSVEMLKEMQDGRGN